MQAYIFRRTVFALASGSCLKRREFLTCATKIHKISGSINIKHFRSSIPMSSHKNVSFGELKELLGDEHNVVIDVREKQELIEDGCIKGAHHIPLGEVNQALQLDPPEFEAKYGFPKPNPFTKIVFSCRSGKRSLNACGLAEKLGYKNLCNYGGGFLDWSEQTKGK